MDLLQEHNPQNYRMENRSYASYDELYDSITKDGSLGLLALGSRGLLIWRKKRAEIEAAESASKATLND
ncbi:MAG: hypothetical protein M1378_11860 [Bacteroidetes bacterium]|nr:hypothetical protein [Bacteroidota bacterium]